MNSNRPIGIIKKITLLILISIPFILLFKLSQYPAPLFPITFLMILVPLFFYIFQYYKMKIDGDFRPLYVSIFYIFLYYLSVILLFIENVRWSLSIVVIIYIVIHFVAYFIFIYILSRHKRWIIINGVFARAIYIKKEYRNRCVYSVEIFRDIISMLTKIAKSDGVVSTKEASFISSMIDEFMEIYRDENGTKREVINLRRELIERYKSTKDNNITIESYSYALAHHSHYQRVKVLQELVDIAYLDGLTREKEKMIYTIGDIFRFDKPQIYRYMTGYSNSEGKERDIYEYSYIKLDSYHILGVKRSDDLATIKRKYRKLVKEYHPDTLKGMGASENEILIAKEKMQELNDAYDVIKKTI